MHGATIVGKYLIVGGAGFIGSNLAGRLASHELTIVDNLLTGSTHNLPEGAKFIEGDATTADLDGDWDAIFHFGGASSAPLFDEDPNRAHQAISLFQAVLEAARKSNAPVAFASTSSMYNGLPKPYREDMAVQASTLYEFSKLSMEQLARSYAKTYGLNITAFRFFSVYGPNEQGKQRFANIISQFLWCLKSGISPLIYGDGTQTRDFTHVSDLVDAIMLAYPKTEGFQVYNIGTGVEHTFNQILDKLRGLTGSDVAANFIANPYKNYVQETQADFSRLAALGWAPKTDVAAGLQQLVASAEELRSETIEAMATAHALPA